jgi:hypothetical protein
MVVPNRGDVSIEYTFPTIIIMHHILSHPLQDLGRILSLTGCAGDTLSHSIRREPNVILKFSISGIRYLDMYYALVLPRASYGSDVPLIAGSSIATNEGNAKRRA